MFKISTRGDYGLLFLSALAEKLQNGRQFVSLKEIVAEKHLSLSYLTQIALPLKRAGILKSKEGREGGYALAKKPTEIRLIEVLEILEGPVAPVRCCESNYGGAKPKKCGSENFCNVKSVWHAAQLQLKQFLSSKTLADTLSHKNLYVPNP